MITDNGGATLPHRDAATTGALGVTFGFSTDTLNGSHQNQGNAIYNLLLDRDP